MNRFSVPLIIMSVILVSCGKQNTRQSAEEYVVEEMSKPFEDNSNLNDKKKFIKSIVSIIESRLPLAVDHATTLVEVNLTANTLTYKYEINDFEFSQNIDSSISFLKYITLSQISNNIKDGIQGENNKEFYQALADCNYGIESEYHELSTGKRAVFRISANEIREVLNGKYDNQPTPEEWDELSDAIDQLEAYEEEVI